MPGTRISTHIIKTSEHILKAVLPYFCPAASVVTTRTFRNRKNGATPIQPSDLKQCEKVAAAVARHNKQTLAKAKRVNDTENKIRRAKLEEDDWTINVRPLFVDCRGCYKTIKLDGRNPDSYYRTNWIKHKKICRKILEAQNRQDVCTSGLISEDVTDNEVLPPSTDNPWKPTSHCRDQHIDYPASKLRPAKWTDEENEPEDGEYFLDSVDLPIFTERRLSERYFSDSSATEYSGNTRESNRSTLAYTSQFNTQAHPRMHMRTVLYENHAGPAYSFHSSERSVICQNNIGAYNFGVYNQMQQKERHAIEFLTNLWKLRGQT
ncbi:hypothetical protein C0989_008001 [Termitomyces sp. Mn162]|nr:hypothetical protein C0989_008001 [Termitomyces sp. Mn162]